MSRPKWWVCRLCGHQSWDPDPGAAWDAHWTEHHAPAMRADV